MPYVMRLPTLTGADGGSGGGPAPHAVLWHFNSDLFDTSATVEFQIGTLDTGIKKFGAGSMLVTDSSASATYDFGQHFGGSWTLEAWFRVNSFQNLSLSIETNKIVLDYNSAADTITWHLDNNSIVNSAKAAAITNDTFEHWAIVRDKAGGRYSLYFNGVRLEEVVTATDVTTGLGGITLVASQPTATYVDDLRFSPSALYSGATYGVPVSQFPD